MSERFADTFAAIKTAIDQQSEAFSLFRKANDEAVGRIEEKVDDVIDRVEELEARRTSPGKTPEPGTKGQAPKHEVWIDRKTGEAVPVLDHKDRLSDLDQNKTGVSVGRWLRGVLMGKHASDQRELAEEMKALATTPDASGGYTVPTPLAAEFIDMLRSRSVLSRAGARTVPMTSKTLSMAKIIGDAAVAWHAENGSITDTEPTFDVVTLSAKTVVGLVKLSLELSQDSVNVEQAIVRSLTEGTALAIDRAGLGNTVSNGPSGVLSFTGRGQVTSIGALASYDKFLDALALLLRANVPEEKVGPIVLGPQAYIDLAKLKTGISSDKTPLMKPAVLSMPLLPTTSVETGFDASPVSGASTAYMADWSDLLWGVRKDITVRVLNEAFIGSNLQVAVLVYARMDFQAAREQSFVTLEDITH